MGTVFKQSVTRPLPKDAEIVTKAGQRVARWRVRGGKLRSAPLSEDGSRIVTQSSTYYARFRNADGCEQTKPTGCKDEQAARQMLAGWEREVEQIRAGTLDPRKLSTAKRSSEPLKVHLADYERSLIASEVSESYRANVLRAVRRVAGECGFATLTDFERESVEGWLAARLGDQPPLSARSRNYYRESVIAFLNWAVAGKRLMSHDLDRLPKADVKSDPRRKRRSLTQAELVRLLAVASERPLNDARTVRRGKAKGEAVAKLTTKNEQRLRNLGRERALIYKTLVLTGLRLDELRTLAVAQLDFTPGFAFLQLDAVDEKSKEGSSIALRDDIADDLRQWIIDTKREGTHLLFRVPSGLRRILDRDLKAAGIPKRDDRGRTIDVHAMRTTFGTLMSRAGVSPRTAQQAMRHSDIKLTMGVYTDPRLIDTREAVEKLPALPLLNGSIEADSVTCPVTCPTVHTSQFGATLGIYRGDDDEANEEKPVVGIGTDFKEKPSETGVPVSEGSSRADRIRTCDLLVPNLAAPRSDASEQVQNEDLHSGYTSGYIPPPELHELVALWPTLPGHIRATILTIIEANRPAIRKAS
jgi:integrase